METDNRFYDLDKVFDNHELYNKYLVFGGNRQGDPVIRPSIYITAMKLKRALKELNHEDLEQAINEEMDSLVHGERMRKELIEKIEYGLLDWQLFQALNILLGLGRIEAIAYVHECKPTDVEPE